MTSVREAHFIRRLSRQKGKETCRGRMTRVALLHRVCHIVVFSAVQAMVYRGEVTFVDKKTEKWR